MAPMDQLCQDTLEDLRRRQDSIDRSSLRQRDGDTGGGGGKRRDGNDDGDGPWGNNGGGPNGNGNGKGNENGNGNAGNNGKKDDQPPPPPPSLASSQSAVLPPSLFPTTVATTAVSKSTSTTVVAASSTHTFISSFFPVTTTPFPAITTTSYPPDSSSPGRKGLSDDPEYPTSRIPTTVTATTTWSMYIASGSAITSSTSVPDQNKDNNSHQNFRNDGSNLSPMAQHLLIAAGAIGAFIIVVAGLFFLSRVRKIDLLASFRNRKFRRGGRRGWYGFRKQKDYRLDAPPKYPSETYPSEKSIPIQQQVEAFYTRTAVPPVATPASSANALSRSETGRQDMIRETLLDNPAPFTTTPVPQAVGLTAIENFYNTAAQPESLSREPGTQISQSTFVSQPNSNYNNAGTQKTFLTMDTMRSVRTTDAYDPAQREPNHLSYLSSISSGFGDGLIIPEPTVVGGGRQSYRQSRAPAAGRFSWMTANSRTPVPNGNRDTVYTTASVESAPRYRTVNSWVVHQAGQVECQPNSDQVPAIPPIPRPTQTGIDHQRKASENPAFQHHPGDEVEMSKGSRVPSVILDKKIGFR